MIKIFYLMLATLSVSSLECDIGDKKPFCFFPEIFHTSLEAANVQLDVQRYMGDWHEVARTPNRFEKDCVCSEAHYEFNTEKKFIQVTNSCRKKDGSFKSAKAKAYPKNDNMTIYKLYFVPVFGGNYWILDLAEDYSYAVIGEPCRDSLYILSRTEELHHDVMQHLLQKAQK